MQVELPALLFCIAALKAVSDLPTGECESENAYIGLVKYCTFLDKLSLGTLSSNCNTTSLIL